MARLLDSSGLSYSLSNLTEQYEKDIQDTKQKLIEFYEKQGENPTLKFYKENFFKIRKQNLLESFGFYKTLRNGGVGKVVQFPEIEEQHQNPIFIRDWIEYSCFDAEITFFLYKTLHRKLK